MNNEPICLPIQGMTCNHCAATVGKIIEREGGSDIHVDYLLGEARFDIPSEKRIANIIKRLAAAGYQADFKSASNVNTKVMSAVEKKFLWTLPFSALLFSHMFSPANWWINEPITQLLLCIPVFIIGIAHFGRSTLEGFKNGVLSMDTLILVGSSSAFIYSVLGLGWHGPDHDAHRFLFFETTSTIITLVLLGNVIEHRAVQRTTTILRELIKSVPEKAKRLRKVGLVDEIEIVLVDTLKENDVVLVNTGDRIPADGRILYGDITVDEAMLSGEATPIQKTKDTEILGGSTVLSGSAAAQVLRNANQSTLGRIIDLVKTSRSDKPNIQKLADRISARFVPMVIFIGLSTFIINTALGVELSESMMRAIAVLVVACPCAMGLATPTAVSVGLGVAGKFGIIVKRASIFETLGTIKTIVFDKTGTLTTGQLTIVGGPLPSAFKSSDVLGIAKTLESHSSHPISLALQKQLNEIESQPVERIAEVAGQGIIGSWQRKEVKIGSASFVDTDTAGDLFLKIENDVVAVWSLTDDLKPNAVETISELYSSETNIHLISGDSKTKVMQVANRLGIKNAEWGQLPQEKLNRIQELQTSGPTAMVGDGINDAAALQAAQVGISVGTAHALAADCADVVILNGQINNVSRLFRISQRVVSTIRQNLFWAFSYNIVAIPLAAMGYLDPMLAALSMAFSDVIVIGNSLRLRMFLANRVA